MKNCYTSFLWCSCKWIFQVKETRSQPIPESNGQKYLYPNVIIYTLIGKHFKKDNLQKAFRFHDEMIERNLTLDDPNLPSSS